jgi:hypothetical protein
VPSDGTAQAVVDEGVEHGSYSGVSTDRPSRARRRSHGLGR